jgi:hypothetical protein
VPKMAGKAAPLRLPIKSLSAERGGRPRGGRGWVSGQNRQMQHRQMQHRQMPCALSIPHERHASGGWVGESMVQVGVGGWVVGGGWVGGIG